MTKNLYILMHNGYPIEDYYQEGNAPVYYNRKDAVAARFIVCGLLGLDNKDVSILKYTLVKEK